MVYIEKSFFSTYYFGCPKSPRWLLTTSSLQTELALSNWQGILRTITLYLSFWHYFRYEVDLCSRYQDIIVTALWKYSKRRICLVVSFPNVPQYCCIIISTKGIDATSKFLLAKLYKYLTKCDNKQCPLRGKLEAWRSITLKLGSNQTKLLLAFLWATSSRI